MRPTDPLPAALTRRPGSVRPHPRPDPDGADGAALPPALARRRGHPDERRPDYMAPDDRAPDDRKDAVLVPAGK
jgi:hypothetical protein